MTYVSLNQKGLLADSLTGLTMRSTSTTFCESPMTSGVPWKV